MKLFKLKIVHNKLLVTLLWVAVFSAIYPFPLQSPISANDGRLGERSILFEDHFNRPDGLVTNEHAYRDPEDPEAVLSDDWETASGSFFTKDGAGWTGLPDSCPSPNPMSSDCTNSNVFRLMSKKEFGGNVNVSFQLKHHEPIDNSEAWHGVHIYLLYQSQYDLYALSVNRADGKMVIKRKVPCGPSNQGTYITLSEYIPYSIPLEAWNNYNVTVETEPSGDVYLAIFSEDTSTPLVSAVDRGGINQNWTPECTVEGAYPGKHYPPLSSSGQVGVRGDFANFSIDNFQVFFDVSDRAYLPLVGDMVNE